jgi:hypothetical protein
MMSQFVRGLFTDLLIKIDKMSSVLNGRTMPKRIASAFKRDTLTQLDSIRAEIVTIFDSGLLDSSNYMRNLIIKYRSLANDLLDIELYRYMAIVNYRDQADGYFEDLLTRIYKEIGSLQIRPFVSTFSNSDTYYWAEIGSGMIALPYGEERNILNLSDLYHEIGHFLFDQYKIDFIGQLPAQIDLFYKKKQDSFAQAADALNRWETTWTEEFSCDLIATFFTGPVYAWTNLKISTASSVKNVYGNTKSETEHPANEARMRAIFAMLRLTGHQAELVEIEKTWNDFLKNIGRKPSVDYETFYPQEFIDSLAQSVFDGCRNIALRSYEEQIELSAPPVSLALNDAWRILQTSPDEFENWELKMITEFGFVG